MKYLNKHCCIVLCIYYDYESTKLICLYIRLSSIIEDLGLIEEVYA